MSNPSKSKGTAAETAALRWLREHGFPWTERLTLAGIHDRGDLSLLPGCAVIAEVKNTKQGATGQPPAKVLHDWMRQTETERVNAQADTAALIVKRGGTTDVGRWFAYLPLAHLLHIERGANSPTHDDNHAGAYRTPVCVTVAAWTELLRRGGWGQPWDDEEGTA